MTKEAKPNAILLVRKKLTDNKWYWQYKDDVSDWIDDKNDNGPYETRVKAIKAAYRFENPEKDTSMVDDKDRILIAMGFICLGIWVTQGFGYACMALGALVLGRLLWQHINQIKDVKQR